MKFQIIISLFLFLASCNSHESGENITTSGKTVRERIGTPAQYEWVKEEEKSFGEYLQNISLKPEGAKILDYEGSPIANQSEHVAVLEFDVGKKDLQQCADAVIRIRAEYLYSVKRYDEIAFHFTSGDLFKWNDFKKGIRPQVEGNKVSFKKTAKADNSYNSFRKYLDVVYTYAGTISLNKETKKVKTDKAIKAGDILITPGSPGHAIIIVGQAKNKNGEMIYLLAEGYTPAQSIHIISNPYAEAISPWYKISVNDESTTTARYTFEKTNIRSF